MCVLDSSDRWFGAKVMWAVSDMEGPIHQMLLFLLFLLLMLRIGEVVVVTAAAHQM